MFCSFFVFSLQEGMSGNTKLASRVELCKNAAALLSMALQTVLSPLPTFISLFVLCYHYCLCNFDLLKFTSQNPIPPISLFGSLDLITIFSSPLPFSRGAALSLLFTFHIFLFLMQSFILSQVFLSLVPWPNANCLHAGFPQLLDS